MLSMLHTIKPYLFLIAVAGKNTVIVINQHFLCFHPGWASGNPVLLQLGSDHSHLDTGVIISEGKDRHVTNVRI